MSAFLDMFIIRYAHGMCFSEPRQDMNIIAFTVHEKVQCAACYFQTNSKASYRRKVYRKFEKSRLLGQKPSDGLKTLILKVIFQRPLVLKRKKYPDGVLKQIANTFTRTPKIA